MAERATLKPVLQRPPGYRDPTAPRATAPRPPPRKPQLPPTFRQTGKSSHRYRRRPSCCRLCCWLILILLAIAFLLSVAGALAYLWFQPRLPSFRLESLQSPQFRIAARSDGTFLDAVTVLKILASNPNGKIELSYGGAEARVSVPDDDGDLALGSAWIPGFEQGKKNATTMKFSASAKGVMVDDAVGSRLRARFQSKEIRFAVEVRTKVGFRIGGKMTGQVPIRVICGTVSLKQVRRGGTVLPKCDINFLRWINLH